MSEYEPCPHCGREPEVAYIGGNTCCRCSYCSEGCWMTVDIWNSREGVPKKCCANCKHCDVWDQGVGDMPYIKCGNPEKKDDWGEDHDLPYGVTVCEKWEGA